MKRAIIVLFLVSSFFCSKAYAIPVFYSLHGTATAISDEYPPLHDDISGTMVIDSVPNVITDGHLLYWMVDSITITSDIFLFNGSGFFTLLGDKNGIYDFNEAGISGYGATPYNQGVMYTNDGVPNLFYFEDDTPWEMTFPSYSKGLPYMIAPAGSAWPSPTGGWQFLSAEITPYAVVSNFRAERLSVPAPVPEPSTILLIAIGLIGLVGWGKKDSAYFLN